jgi:DNA adenine methylase
MAVPAKPIRAGRQPTHVEEAEPFAIGELPRRIEPSAEVAHPLAAGRYQSPLRYPGAKSGLAKIIGELVESATLSPQVRQIDMLVEPFAGGAATALRLAGAGVVERVLLADADPLVAAFWQVAAARTDELIDRISDEYANYVAAGGTTALERWDYWRAWHPNGTRGRRADDLDLAVKCLFLNRTTFSGILHGRAGPIGGRRQESAYGIGCRFNVDALTQRLEYVGHLYETNRLVDVWRSDWKDTLQGVATWYKALLPDRVVAYLDPPYLSKSGKLYRQSFDKTSRSEAGVDLDWTAPLQHYQLARFLRTEMQFRWILSYDFDPLLLEEEGLYASKAMHPSVEVREMLGVRSWRISKRKVTLNYTASSRTGRGAAAELLLTTLPPSTVPNNHRLSGIS